MNFLVFGTTGIMSPLVSALMGKTAPETMEQFHTAFLPLVIGIGIAIVLGFCLKETGWKVRKAS